MKEGAEHKKFDISDGLTPETVEDLRKTVEQWLSLAGVSPSLIGILVIVIEEICTNIMDHSEATWMDLGAAWFEDGIMVTITDNGAEFDPTEKIQTSDLEASLDEHAERHLGLPMIQKICETFAYVRDPRGVNRLVMEIPDKQARPEAG